MSHIDRSTIDAVASGKDGTQNLGTELVVPDRFSQALASLGYQPVHHLPAKRGSWDFYSHEVLPQEQQPSGSAVAFYQNNKGQVSYLFMTQPGTTPNLEEMVHNAEIITSGLLEKNPSRAKIITITAVAGAVLANVAIEVSNHFTGFLDSLGNRNRVIVDFVYACLGAAAGGLCTGAVLMKYNDEISGKAVARMSDPDNYLYGEQAATVIRAGLGYNELLKSGAREVTREAFNSAISRLGISMPT